MSVPLALLCPPGDISARLAAASFQWLTLGSGSLRLVEERFELVARNMRILIAEDDVVSRTMLKRTLERWGHEVVVTCDGQEAWEALEREDAPQMAILDWMMPRLDGVEVCRRVRALAPTVPTYLILLTAKGQAEDAASGLDSGANDYVRKPFNHLELKSRLQVGERMVALQRDLTTRVHELEQALTQIKQLQGMLPICSYCKKIRDDQNYWQQVESYIECHVDVQFSHGICPDCFQRVVASEFSQPAVPPPG
jgi:phosphoserine phosphatase RsbU/P